MVRTVAVHALRTAIAVGALGTLGFQVVMVPLIWIDLTEVGEVGARLPTAVVLVLGAAMVQVVLVASWRLATLAREDRFFSPEALPWVDAIATAVGLAAVLLLGLGAALAPGDAVPPGLVLLLGVAAVLIGALALVVVVVRTLLTQATARDVEAHHLRAELDGVI